MARHSDPKPLAAVGYHCLCFDFDGTLVNSMDAAFRALQRVGSALGCKPLSLEEMDAFRGLHLREVIQRLGIPLHRIPRLVRRLRAAMRDDLMETPPIVGIADALTQCADAGYRLGVLTSNDGASVEDYLARHGFGQFDFVIGGVGLFGKAAALRSVVRRERIGPRELLYVGDELRDQDAARSAGVGFAAVGWGYTDLDRLAAAGPEWLLVEPGDLLGALGLTRSPVVAGR